MPRSLWGVSSDSPVINTTAEVAFLSFRGSGSMDHGLPHGFWKQREPWTSTWSPVSTHTTDLSMVSGGSTDQGHQCDSYTT